MPTSTLNMKVEVTMEGTMEPQARGKMAARNIVDNHDLSKKLMATLGTTVAGQLAASTLSGELLVISEHLTTQNCTGKR